MVRIVSMLILSLLGTVSVSAALRGEDCKVVTDTIRSSILGCPRAVNVYLPENYSVETQKSYPVLYLLHGLSGCNEDWNKRGHVRDVMSALVNSGECGEMIIVMPTAGADHVERSRHGYFNEKGWRYEDYFFTELIPWVERNFRVKADKRHRALAGLSMGGGGTVVYAQHHPEMFCAAYAMSALVGLPEGMPRPEDPMDKERILFDSAERHDCILFVKNASEDQKAALRTVDWFIDCGDDDFLLQPNLDFSKAMRQAGIPMQMRIREGDHVWEYWHSALYICLPYVSRIFTAQ